MTLRPNITRAALPTAADLAERTLVILRTDHGLAFPGLTEPTIVQRA